MGIFKVRSRHDVFVNALSTVSSQTVDFAELDHTAGYGGSFLLSFIRIELLVEERLHLLRDEALH